MNTFTVAQAFGKIRQQIDPKVAVRYKDVSYQTLGDAAFREAIEAQFGPTSFANIFSEYDAAREQAPARAPYAK